MEPVSDHTDHTSPIAPVIRQAVAFNWDKGGVSTYQASVAQPKNGPLPYFLPGQVVSISTSSSTSTLVPATSPEPTPTLHATYSSSPPSPAVHPSTSPASSSQSVPRKKVKPSSSSSPSRNKKSESKARHFNDNFADQTGRFKIGTSYSHDSEGSQHPPITHGSGPYSSMYRMEMGPPVPQAVNKSSASPQRSSISRQATQKPQVATNGQSDISPSNGETVVNVSSPTLQPKAPRSKVSTSKRRSPTKQDATDLASSLPSQHYRRDYEREHPIDATSRNTQNLNGRSQASVASTPQHQPHPHEAVSYPSLSNTTLHTTSGENLVEAHAHRSASQPVEHVSLLTL